ncbi:Pls/PosA family non-ribosomal peptide synthetase [Arthrobacter sp. 92]|uniref:Pls/PosA family non-ribosomal peptide synthetase n=1 Tax=Arthrobacter sp. 92 TaxID=3418175 RepID=UPI003CFD5D50
MGKHVAAAAVLNRSRGRNHSPHHSATRHGPEPTQALPAAEPDQGIRWRPGERLDELFEDRCDRLRAEGEAGHIAVDAGDRVLTYDQLDARANQLARHLVASGAGPGDRIALLFDNALYAYLGMLAVLKIRAAYVPLDPGFPAERLSYIIDDAGVRLVLSLSHLVDRLPEVAAPSLSLDEQELVVTTLDDSRLTDAEKGAPVDELAYIIYTSGSTGRPKGVAIEHASICNFVRVAAEVYGYVPADRVYQGLTIAFDFSMEEIWVPWMAGATLVPKPSGSTLLGADLADYVRDRRISALCCVPTLLATIDEDLPGLRFLLVSGEACPDDLVRRWHRAGRRFLNVYGPTEATVTATWTALDPERPVTLGVPLPSYSAVILDPLQAKALPPGEMGEIGLAGIGLARGYVNRQDLTERAFVPDFLGLPNNPRGRIYRTGDLGRINKEGEIEYHGRIDTQVKIRGYRIELAEIESVLLQVPGVAQAVVNTFEPVAGLVELVAYYSLRTDAGEMDPGVIRDWLRERLPGYMVPAYLERLDVVPMLPSGKTDRKSLQPPSGDRAATSAQEYAAPANEMEQIIATELGEAIGMKSVSAEANFFNDLGANSLLLAHFCARVRKRGDLPSIAMQDVYLQPTVRSLAAVLADRAAEAGVEEAGEGQSSPAVSVEPAARARTGQYVLCGLLQAVVLVGYAYLDALAIISGYGWVAKGDGLLEIYVRAMVLGGSVFLGMCLVPLLAKWLLIGRWKRQQIPIWSLAYFRFWTVRMLLRFSPLALLTGSPLYVMYLRALGAKIGRNVAILSRAAPICTDLLTIGDGTVIRKDSVYSGYRAQGGLIQTGRITIGRNAFIGEATVIDIETTMGDGAQLGHSSCLQSSQAIPDGQHWHGTPAQPTTTNYLRIDAPDCGRLRPIAYCTMQIATLLFVSLPLVLGLGGVVFNYVLADHDVLSGWTYYQNELVAALVLLFVPIVGGLIIVFTVPRVVNIILKPDRLYPLYGIHYSAFRTISRYSNQKFFKYLFGDSPYIVYYLQALGYDLGKVQQTGSNFGVEVKHDTPFLSTVGSGTMVSDGLSLINTDVSNTSFRLSRAAIGANNYVGNDVYFPTGARTGDNCLLATKVMIPVDGPLRENVGLLGSPPFEIPRYVQRDTQFDYMKTGDEFRRRLGAMTRHNTVTIGLFLLVRWAYLFWMNVLFTVAGTFEPTFGAAAMAVAVVASVVFSVLYFGVVERAGAGFRDLRPQYCSIYEPYFWWHERFWKLSAGAAIELFNGTPFKPLIWRLLGVRIGKRVFDDGCAMPEKTLITIGDDCTLNTGSCLQCHSLEEGTFKSDFIKVGARCTVGTNATIHYGVTVGDGAVIETDSFVMKGEDVPDNRRFGGNPAREITKARAPLPREP